MLKVVLKIVLLLAPLNSYACVALLYHHFDTKTPPSTSISPKLFEEQLKYIHDNDFSVLTIEELVSSLQNQEPLPSKCVVLTADDAYMSIYTNAYPILKKYNYPMSVFISTDGVDKKYGAYMEYETMRSMKGLVSFYNHSSEHEHLYMLSKQDVVKNVNNAQQRLEEELGTKSKFFAYPYGEYSLENYETMKELGYVAFGQHSGAIGLNSDLSTLPRFPMTNKYGNMKSFRTKVNTLPMPVVKENPISQVATQNPPILKLKLQNKLELNCFVNGDLASVKWHENEVTIVAKNKLPLGRVKYNCTSFNRSEKRFHWYSKQWILKPNLK